MKKSLCLLVVAMLCSKSFGATIAATSFENETPTGTQIVTATNETQDLDNSMGAIVDSTVTTELGYDSSFEYVAENAPYDNGLTDGDWCGVQSSESTVHPVPVYDGTQSFELDDADGRFILTFDAVDISGYTDVAVNLAYFVADTAWETAPEDNIYIHVDVDSTAIPLLDTRGSDIDSLGIEGVWTEISQPISGSSAQLVVEFVCNSSAELLFIDDVSFTGVPEPASLTLVGLAGLLGLSRRRK